PLRQFSLKIETAESRKTHIENEATGHIRQFCLEKFLSRLKRLTTQSHGFDQLLYSRAHRRVVIDHEYKLVCFLHQPLPLPTGTVNCIVAPLSSFGEAHSVPPWASTIVRLIESPRPMPSAFVVKNGSKIRST